MRYEWIDKYLLSRTGVTKDIQEDWNWIRYRIGGKMFVAVCLDDEDKPYYITLKLEPMEGEFLRNQYEDIIPGYYMNKVHWNSIKADGEVPDDLLKDLLDKSYQLVLDGFSKKKAAGDFGDVFHMPEGQACAIYQCSVNQKGFHGCGECSSVPCEIWRKTKAPNFSEEEFEQNIRERVARLQKRR